jgi:hypothetical protein
VVLRESTSSESHQGQRDGPTPQERIRCHSLWTDLKQASELNAAGSIQSRMPSMLNQAGLNHTAYPDPPHSARLATRGSRPSTRSSSIHKQPVYAGEKVVGLGIRWSSKEARVIRPYTLLASGGKIMRKE